MHYGLLKRTADVILWDHTRFRIGCALLIVSKDPHPWRREWKSLHHLTDFMESFGAHDVDWFLMNQKDMQTLSMHGVLRLAQEYDLRNALLKRANTEILLEIRCLRVLK